MADPETVELGVKQPPGDDRRLRARVRAWRGVTGALAAGWGVVAVVLLGAQCYAWATGGEGPGAFSVVGHAVGAGGAVVAQHDADRSRGRRAALAGAAVAVLTVLLLWLFWWS